jgi:outer membrane receptor protein involved in Fe transport
MDPGYGSPSSTNPAYRANFQMPGYAVTNLRTGFNVRGEKKTDLQVFVNFSNLFDVRYREPYSQQQLQAPGFSALIGTRVRF